jgi:hypothetical protein
MPPRIIRVGPGRDPRIDAIRCAASWADWLSGLTCAVEIIVSCNPLRQFVTRTSQVLLGSLFSRSNCGKVLAEAPYILRQKTYYPSLVW